MFKDRDKECGESCHATTPGQYPQSDTSCQASADADSFSIVRAHYCLGAPPAHIFSASSVTAVKDGSVEVESMARYPAAGPVVATHAQCRCLDALDEHDTLDLAAIARVLCDHSPRSVPRPFTHNESSRSFSRVPRAASPSRKCAQSTVVYQRSAFPRTVSRAVVHQNSIRLSLRTLDHWGLVGMNEPAEPFVGTRGHLPITHTSSK